MNSPPLSRRRFIQSTAGATLSAAAGASHAAEDSKNRPNILYLFSDQWRASDHGYAGNREVITPYIDALASQSVNFTHAVSGIPVCCPHRASLLTGKRPLTHGLYLNDLSLSSDHRSIAHCLNDSGYQTGYIGKWHIDGQGRQEYTPPERRQGFQFWRALECPHNYNKSAFYANSSDKIFWKGYDAIAQTREAEKFLKNHSKKQGSDPFALFLSWGPPHAPYHTAPDKYKSLYAQKNLTLRNNVPDQDRETALNDYRGYYAHMTALDDCLGDLMKTLEETGLSENTIVVYTSDHGDMLHSHGFRKKQQPWDESLRVPFLVRWPSRLKNKARKISMPIDTPDIMPTLLGLTGETKIPDEVDGCDLSQVILGKQKPDEDYAALITCPQPFGQWNRSRGGREYRGIRTTRHTYCRDLNGPWLFYDNEADPFQQNNLVGKGGHAQVQKRLEEHLQNLLKESHDEFLPGSELVRRSGYVINEKSGTVNYNVPFNPANYTNSPLG